MKASEIVDEIRKLSKEGGRFKDLAQRLQDYRVWLFKCETLWKQAGFRRSNLFQAEAHDARFVLNILEFAEGELGEGGLPPRHSEGSVADAAAELVQ